MKTRIMLFFVLLAGIACNGQSTIILKSGDEMRVNIKAKTADKIFYTLVDDTTGLQYFVNLEDVRKIIEISTLFPLDPVTGHVLYSEVVTIDGKTAEQLYLRAKEWFAVSFNDSRRVIELDDDIGHKIIGNGIFYVSIKNFGRDVGGGIIEFTITLQFKDGRYKVEISDFNYKESALDRSHHYLEPEKPAYSSISRSNWAFIQQQVDEKARMTLLSLKTFLLETEEHQNW